jgi:hypothetical protein
LFCVAAAFPKPPFILSGGPKARGRYRDLTGQKHSPTQKRPMKNVRKVATFARKTAIFEIQGLGLFS